MAKKVQFVETVLRDANQSLIATRLPYDKFEPMLETIDKAGYYAAECWGGATFDVCLRYLHEDPWERLRKIRAKMPNTKLQMLLRGQNVLGYSHYPDDFVKLFVTKAVENGMDVIRIFDALNDVKNLKVAMEATNKAGAIASGTISYTTSPVHTQKKYVEMVKELKEMGAKTICIKDMAGIMGPKEAYDLVSAIKDAVDLPIDLHTHSTTGLAFMTYLKAVEAGVDIIDTAISPFSGGTSQPATETMAYALRQLGYEVDLDDACTKKIADYFKGVRDEYIKDGTLMPKSLTTDTQCLTYQVPGGMLSNLLSQLKQMNALDRFDEALLETPKVRADLGYPPLVTPTSQMVGVQAVRNVLDGERYKTVSKEIKAYCRGEYGTTPAPINPEIQKKILGDEKPITGRYADTLEPVVDKTRKQLEGVARSDEDVLSYIAFPNLAEKFFQERKEKEENTATYSIVEA
ncbi:MAG TPA: pyruvate carboxylase subunit B [Candidatus Faecousia excrementipullorum]|nr:pyruvate carboxylase subunit B [Candidatus Faecousia excrementipullorum]